MVAAFRPGIGKEQIKSFDRLRRQQIAHGIGSFHLEDADIVDLVRFAAGPADTTAQTFDTEKVFLGKFLRELAQKRAVPAAEVDLQRRAAFEDFLQIERRDVVLRDKFDHGEKCAGSGAVSIVLAASSPGNPKKARRFVWL